MSSIDPTTGMAIVIVIAALISVVSTIIRTVYTVKRTPPIGEDHATIRAEVSILKGALDKKQDETLCISLHKHMASDLDEIRTRLNSQENKISRQVGDLHSRIDKQTKAISANGARLETFMDEIRSWRNNRHA